MLRKLLLIAALSPAIWLSTASALSLGEIDVKSKLNQRFSATIPINALDADEAENVLVRLAENDAFVKAGVDRSDYLSTLTFEVLNEGGSPRIVITSKQIAREPVISLLLDVRSKNGHVQREFTVLLDPPDYVQPSTQTASQRPESSAPPVSIPRAQKKRPSASGEPSPDQDHTETGTYGPVAEGETLWGVATELRPNPDITMDQMQLALYNANRSAFEGGRIGRLLKGAMLRVPTEKVITSISPAKAKARVQQLRAGVTSFKRRPDFKKPERQAEVKPVEPAAPAIAAPVAEPAPAVVPRTKPQAVAVEPPRPAVIPPPAPTPKAPAPTPKTEVPPAAPIAEPAVSAPTPPVPAAPIAAPPASAVVAAEPVQTRAASNVVANPAASAVVATGEAPPAVITQPESTPAPYVPPPIPVGPEPTPLMEELEWPIKIGGGIIILAGLLAWFLLDRKKKNKNKSVAYAKPVAVRKPFNWQFWKKEGAVQAGTLPPLLPIGKAPKQSSFESAVAAVAATAAVTDSREEDFEKDYEATQTADVDATQKGSRSKFPSETQKLSQTMSDTSQRLSDTAQLPNFDSTQIFDAPPDAPLLGVSADSVDFDVTGKFESETLKIDLSSNDPLSEADFHLAYGLYDEAALQLIQASAQQPDRTDIRVKLAEVYFRAGKAAEFQKVAEGLKAQLPPDEWVKVALMGRQLSPDAALFQGVDTAALATEMDMVFDEPAAPASSAAPASAARASAGSMDFELSDMQMPPVEQTKKVDAGNSLEFDLSDFSSEEPGAATLKAESTMDSTTEFDLSSFDLEATKLNPMDATIGASTTFTHADDFKLDDFDLNMPGDSAAISTGDEASTKLDLARAYVDMGDNDMARSLLNEVMQQGSATQKTEAQTLLGRLA